MTIPAASKRRLVTQALTAAAQSYWLYKGFSCFTERVRFS